MYMYIVYGTIPRVGLQDPMTYQRDSSCLHGQPHPQCTQKNHTHTLTCTQVFN